MTRLFLQYLLTFLLLLGFSFYLPLKDLEYYFYKSIYIDSDDVIDLDENILIVDLPRLDDGTDKSLKNFRHRLADLLLTINQFDEKPEAIVLDFYFSSNEDGAKRLTEAIDSILNGSNIEVYRVIDLEKIDPLPDIKRRHYAPLYENATLYGHSIYNIRSGILSYQPCIEVPLGFAKQRIPAIPYLVHPKKNAVDTCDDEIVLALGTPGYSDSQAVSFLHPIGSTDHGQFTADRQGELLDLPSVQNKTLVIGDLVEDQEHSSTPGPVIMASAISDRRSVSVARQPLNDHVAIFTQIVFFGILTAAVYCIFFLTIRSLRKLPVFIGLLASVCTISVLIVYVVIALRLGFVIPVIWTLVSIALSVMLSVRFAYRLLVTSVVEASGEYDVFISYSHAHQHWVEKNVYLPLQNTSAPSGEKLNIFFDKRSIAHGEAFTTKYMWAIVNSKYVLPVFTSDYYEKNHCKNEMDTAYKRYVEKKVQLLPIVFQSKIPEIFSTLNYIDAEENPDFITSVKNTLLSQKTVS